MGNLIPCTFICFIQNRSRILKAINTIKFQIHVLLQLYLKQNARNVLFPNDCPVITLTHIYTTDFNFRAYYSLGKSEIAKINFLHFGTKTAKI